MGLSGASSVLEGAQQTVVGTVFCLDGCGGFAPCGDMSSAGPETATIAEDLPFEHQTITVPLGPWMVQASICQGDHCLTAAVGPVTVGPDCRMPDETWTGPGFPLHKTYYGCVRSICRPISFYLIDYKL